MSKVSAMQAMREARYRDRSVPKPAAIANRAPVVVAATITTVEAGSVTPEGPPAELALLPLPEASTVKPDRVDVMDSEVADEDTSEPEALCGHRSMNNRNCRRPAGHPEKNHRYN